MVTQIFEVCIIPLLGILIKYLIDFLNAKRDEAKIKAENELFKKYADMIYDTVTDCVIATNQTYVDSLKAAGKFDEEAQKEAFRRTMDAILAVLSQDAKEYIIESTGDLNTYLTQLTEATVKKIKES